MDLLEVKSLFSLILPRNYDTFPKTTIPKRKPSLLMIWELLIIYQEHHLTNQFIHEKTVSPIFKKIRKQMI